MAHRFGFDSYLLIVDTSEYALQFTLLLFVHLTVSCEVGSMRSCQIREREDGGNVSGTNLLALNGPDKKYFT